MKNRGVIRKISITVLMVVMWEFCGLYQLAYALKDTSGIQKRGSSETGAAVKLEKALSELDDLLTDMDEEVDSRKRDKLRKALKEKRDALADIDTAIREEFSETEKMLKSKGLSSEILDRHYDFVESYKGKYKELIGNIETIRKSGDRDGERRGIKETREFLSRHAKPKRHQSLDPNKLPHRSAQPVNKMPRLTKEEFQRGSGNGKRNKEAVPVSSGEQSAGVSGGKSETKAKIDPPTEADLSETIEILFTPEIIEKVEELEGKTVNIYEFVRNNFQYEPYYGSLKGGPQTFLEMSGNDFDLAGCLLSMLRAAGTPSRYVYGTVEIDIEKVMNWAGGVSDPETAVEILATAGIPGQVVREGSVIKKVQMEHVWVEAYVPYGNYRGAGRDGSLKKWVPLDPSFKQYEYKKGMDLYEGMGINGEQFIYDYIDDDSLLPVPDDNTEPDTEYIPSPHQFYSARMMDYIDTIEPDLPIQEIIGSETIEESMEINSKEYPYLLGSLPYKVLVKGANHSSLPDTYRHSIHISVTNNTTYETDLSYSTTLPETAGKRFTISYIPATTLDEELADQYNGIFNVPPYLINIAPVIMINGEIAVQGNPVGLGYDQTLNLTFHLPNKASDSVINTITAGSYNALAIQYYKTSPSVIGDKMETLINTKEITHIDELLGQILYNLGVSYFHHITHQEYLYEKNLQMVVTREPSEAIVTLHAKTEWLWGVPHRVSEGGVGIDVDRNIYAPFSMDGDKERAKDFMIISVLGSSAWEDMSLEAFFDIPAVSASKILKMARMEGVTIYTIESSNIDTVLPQLEIDSADKNDIRNAVYAGKTVIVPEKKIQYNDWSGAGYVVLDTETGGGGYMISGGLSGGELSRKPDGTLQFCQIPKSTYHNKQKDKLHRLPMNCQDFDPSIYLTGLARATILRVVDSLVGTPYVSGGEDPDCGFDCSGLIDYVFFVVYGRTAFHERMTASNQYIHCFIMGWLHDFSNAIPGDIMWLDTHSHVGIYIDSNTVTHALGRTSCKTGGTFPPVSGDCEKNALIHYKICGKYKAVVKKGFNYFTGKTGTIDYSVCRPTP